MGRGTCASDLRGHGTWEAVEEAGVSVWEKEAESGQGASQCGWGRGDRGRWRAIGAWGSEGVATGQEAPGDRAEGGHGRVSLTLLSVPRATEALMGSQDPRVTRERKGSE